MDDTHSEWNYHAIPVNLVELFLVVCNARTTCTNSSGEKPDLGLDQDQQWKMNYTTNKTTLYTKLTIWRLMLFPRVHYQATNDSWGEWEMDILPVFSHMFSHPCLFLISQIGVSPISHSVAVHPFSSLIYFLLLFFLLNNNTPTLFLLFWFTF